MAYEYEGNMVNEVYANPEEVTYNQADGSLYGVVRVREMNGISVSIDSALYFRSREAAMKYANEMEEDGDMDTVEYRVIRLNKAI